MPLPVTKRPAQLLLLILIPCLVALLLGPLVSLPSSPLHRFTRRWSAFRPPAALSASNSTWQVANSTAEGVALLRLMAATDGLLPAEEEAAMRVLLPARLQLLVDIPGGKAWLRSGLTRGVEEAIVARTRQIDDVLQELLTPTPVTDSAFAGSASQSPPPPAAISQLVILGAGFDSRALRFHPQLSAHNVSVFEVDLPDLQHRKQETLAHAAEVAAGQQPELQQAVERIHFIPINLTEAAARDVEQSGSRRPPSASLLPSLWSALESAGYSSSAPSLFIVEGLTAYLPNATVTDTLQSLHAHAPPESVLVMDFFAADPQCRAGDEYSAVRQHVTEVGEPILFDMDVRQLEGGEQEGETEEQRTVRWNRQHRQEVRDWLSGNGWHLLQHAGPEELTASYIDDAGEQDKRVSCFEHVVVAKNQPQHEVEIEAV